MSTGKYSVIKCIPDPIRGELFNVGVVIWCQGRFNIRIDQAAARRAAKENPALAIDAFSYLGETIHSRLLELNPINTTKFQALRKQERGTIYHFSEPQFAKVPPVGLDHLAVALDKLMDKLVSAKHAPALPSKQNPLHMLENEIAALIAESLVQRNHQIDGKKTMHPRRVDFFVRSGNGIRRSDGHGVALDVLRLDFKDEEAAIRRADAEAFKIFDVKDNGEVSDFYVWPIIEQDEPTEPRLIEEPTHKAIMSVGGKIVRSIAEATAVIWSAVA
jgi:hypothetical protein